MVDLFLVGLLKTLKQFSLCLVYALRKRWRKRFDFGLSRVVGPVLRDRQFRPVPMLSFFVVLDCRRHDPE